MRPTDDVDAAMLAAVAKKTALEGAASVQRAAFEREIIQCSGSFATASKGGRDVNVWEMTVAEKKESEDHSDDMNVAQIKLANSLEHECAIQAIAVSEDRLMIITGDVVGDVFLWKYMRSSTFSLSKDWTKLCRYTPWKDNGRLYTPEEISKQSVVSLCILGEARFLAGSAGGKVRVWSIVDKPMSSSVYKNKSISANVTSETLSCVVTLPQIKDPKTRCERLAFAVSATDGRVVSLALNPKTSELVVFDMNSYSSINESPNEGGIHSLAVCGGSLIAGDGNGDLHISTPVLGNRVLGATTAVEPNNNKTNQPKRNSTGDRRLGLAKSRSVRHLRRKTRAGEMRRSKCDLDIDRNALLT